MATKKSEEEMEKQLQEMGFTEEDKGFLFEEDIENMAFKLHDDGFNIITVEPGTKKPYIPLGTKNPYEWKIYQKNRLSKDRLKQSIESIKKENKEFYIGLIPGEIQEGTYKGYRSFGIDFDDPENIKHLGITLEKCKKVGVWFERTQRKGHHIYGITKTKKNSEKQHDVKLEFFGTTGYLIIYNNFEHELYKLRAMDVEEVFNGWTDLLFEKKGIKKKRKRKIPQLKKGVAKGSRNDSAFKIALDYHKKGLSYDEIIKLVGDWNKKNNPPLPEQELISCVNSACNYIFDNKPNNTNNTNNTNIPNNTNIIENPHLIKHLLEKKKIQFQNTGRGIHNETCYIATYIEDDDGKSHTAVVTSDRKIYIDFGKDKNQIRNNFGLHYREDFYHDVIDTYWSNEIIKKWLFEDYTVDIKDIYQKLLKTIKKYMIYEDSNIYIMMAIDVLRSYFFFLFNSNSRTWHLADPGSGKTNQAMLFRALMFHPIGSPDFSSASIYRTIEGTGATIIIDDFDDLPEEDKQRVNRHIKVNYKRFKSIRADGGKRFRPQGYDAYSHCVVNNTTGVNDDLTQERVVIFRLLKHKDAKDIEVDYKDERFKELRDDLYISLLQYWKEIETCYKNLKVKELKARDLEIFKPQLTIAKILGEDVYNDVLKFARLYLSESKIKDLDGDWEYLLLDYITKELEQKATSVKHEIEFSVNDIAQHIADKLYYDLKPVDFDKKIYQLRRFIGGKLSGYVIFRKTRPHNCVFYHIHMKGIAQILEINSMLGLFKGRLGLLGLLPPIAPKTSLTFFDQKDDILKLSDFVKLDSKKCFEWNDELIEFIKNELGKENPEFWINKNIENKVLEEPNVGFLRFLVDLGGGNE